MTASTVIAPVAEKGPEADEKDFRGGGSKLVYSIRGMTGNLVRQYVVMQFVVLTKNV